MNDESVDHVPPRPAAIKRHKLATRIWHWFNALVIVVMLGSGLMILNAHPHLYWGEYGANFDPSWFDVASIFPSGRIPAVFTIPSQYNLALARRWHLTFALFLAFGLLLFMIVSLVNRHFGALRIRRHEVTPRALGHDIREHLHLRFHDPKNPGAYNILQKIAYAGLIFILLPLAILTGLAMSPGMDAAWPWLIDIFGGRQSARSLHFIAAMGIVLFILVHLALVVLAGPINEIRSMLTGWWRVPGEKG